jgi:hypothetical protein
MGAMKDYQMIMAEIEERYDDLRNDDDVHELHLFSVVLKAAREVLETPVDSPAPYPLDLVLYALRGATHELHEHRKFWVMQNLCGRTATQPYERGRRLERSVVKREKLKSGWKPRKPKKGAR